MFSIFQLLFLVGCSILLGNAAVFPEVQQNPISDNVGGFNALAAYSFPFLVKSGPSEPCGPTNSQLTEGVCVSRERCVVFGGDSIGDCQQGIAVGTCCRFNKQCSATKRSVAVFETVENLMSSGMEGASFQAPEVSGANSGNCQLESLTVRGASNLDGPLRVCGHLTGQHMILSYGSSNKISVIVESDLVNYNIRATQIPCDSINKAPDDCLQYFTSSTAAVKSFGFPSQLNNQRYTICVKPTSEGSLLSWNTCTDMDAEGLALPQRFKVSENSIPCLTDWVAIDSEKRCGQSFTSLMTNTGTDSRIRVNFDENESGDDIFTVELLGTAPDPILECSNIMYPHGEQVYPPDSSRQLCDYSPATNSCQCRFSNIPNSMAQTLSLHHLPMIVPQNYCPTIRGYTASPPMIVGGECKYFANIRVTDTANTGFCLRYQTI